MKVGDKAPDFALKDRYGVVHSLSFLRGKYIVVYFYPKDDTPGCAVEAQQFDSFIQEFKKFDTEVLGISGGDDRSKNNFCEKFSLTLLLLSDNDFGVAKSFGAYGTKNFMGRTYEGVFRKTYILNSSKEIVRIFDNVKPESHAAEILELLKSNKIEYKPEPIKIPVASIKKPLPVKPPIKKITTISSSPVKIGKSKEPTLKAKKILKSKLLAKKAKSLATKDKGKGKAVPAPKKIVKAPIVKSVAKPEVKKVVVPVKAVPKKSAPELKKVPIKVPAKKAQVAQVPVKSAPAKKVVKPVSKKGKK